MTVLSVPPKPVGAGAGAPNVEGVVDPNPPVLLWPNPPWGDPKGVLLCPNIVYSAAR